MEALESRRNLVVPLTLLVSGAILLVSCLLGPYSFDQWWHLQIGADWIEKGLSPRIDHYSFTFPGEEVVHPPVLFEATLYFLTDWFGVDGGNDLFRGITYFTLFGLAALWLRQIRAPAFVYLLVFPLLLCAVQLRIYVRPEIIGYPLMILSLMLYQRADLRLNARTVLPIALVLAFWNIYHTPLFGYIIFFGLFVDVALRLVRERAGTGDWLSWCGWGLLLFLVGFINPDLYHFLFGYLEFSGDWSEYIWEYRSVFYFQDLVAPYVLLPAAILAVFLAARLGRVGYLIVLLIFLCGSIYMARLIPPAGVVMVGILAHLLTLARADGSLSGDRPGIARGAGLALLLLVVAGYAAAIMESKRLVREGDDMPYVFPEALTDYMEARGKQGELFHLFRLGGYLIWRMTPDSSVYIDGRTNILYPIEHYERYIAVLSNPEVFMEEAQRYGIDHAILPSTDAYAVRMWRAGFRLDFSDKHYSLFSRDDASFPELGRLWARPFCWPAGGHDALAAELNEAERLFPEPARLTPLVRFLKDYRDAPNPASVFDEQRGRSLATAHQVRIFAYRALAEAQFGAALRQFERLENLPPKDRLAVVLASLRAGDNDRAQREVEGVLRDIPTWRNLEVIDLVILRALLDELQEAGPLPFLDDQTDRGLTERVGARNLADSGALLDAATFCADG